MKCYLTIFVSLFYILNTSFANEIFFSQKETHGEIDPYKEGQVYIQEGVFQDGGHSDYASLRYVFNNRLQSMSVSIRGMKKVEWQGEKWWKIQFPANTFLPVCSFPVKTTNETKLINDIDGSLLIRWPYNITVKCR